MLFSKKIVLIVFIFLVNNLFSNIILPEEIGTGNIGVISENGVNTENPAFILNNRFNIGVTGNYLTAGVEFGNINNVGMQMEYKINNISKFGLICNYIHFKVLEDSIDNIDAIVVYNYRIKDIIFGTGLNIGYNNYVIDNNNESSMNIGGSFGILYMMTKNFRISSALNNINAENYENIIDSIVFGGIYNISNLLLIGEIGSFNQKIVWKMGIELKYLRNRLKIRSGVDMGGSDTFNINGLGIGFGYKIYKFNINYGMYYIFKLGGYGIHSAGIEYLID